jgi:hypothetical protein
MASTPIPDDVRRFVLTSVPSVPFMEALLLFRASGAQQVTRESLARRLYVPDEIAGELIAQLLEARIIAALDPPATRFGFAPQSGELAALLDSVAACYARSLIEMTQLIHAGRARQAQQFADAFRLRKES